MRPAVQRRTHALQSGRERGVTLILLLVVGLRTFFALLYMFFFYDWSFLHLCIVQGNFVIFHFISRSSFTATTSSFSWTSINILAFCSLYSNKRLWSWDANYRHCTVYTMWRTGYDTIRYDRLTCAQKIKKAKAWYFLWCYCIDEMVLPPSPVVSLLPPGLPPRTFAQTISSEPLGFWFYFLLIFRFWAVH